MHKHFGSLSFKTPFLKIAPFFFFSTEHFSKALSWYDAAVPALEFVRWANGWSFDALLMQNDFFVLVTVLKSYSGFKSGLRWAALSRAITFLVCKIQALTDSFALSVADLSTLVSQQRSPEGIHLGRSPVHWRRKGDAWWRLHFGSLPVQWAWSRPQRLFPFTPVSPPSSRSLSLLPTNQLEGINT